MNRIAYYQKLKALARAVRAEYSLTTPRVLRSDLRRVYKDQGIRIDYWPHPLKRLRGAYFGDEFGPSVLLPRHLPSEPLIFTMGHELKHHLVDRGLLLAYCGPTNEHEPIEIGAEIFAAELVFPEEDFSRTLVEMGVALGECKPEDLVRLKQVTRTTLSYSSLAKRAEFVGFVESGTFSHVRWRKLEEEMYGEPVYKRILRLRGRDR